MSKRSSNVAHYESLGPKRRRTDDVPNTNTALEHLAANADELIASLQVLVQCRGQPLSRGLSPRIELSLSRLSHKLLPSFQQLASEWEDRRTEDQRPEDKGQAKQPPGSQDVVKIPSPSATWDPTKLSLDLPPLPKILDPAIELMALTHPGYDGKMASYERLEWLGDAYIEVIATTLIYNTFPYITAGRCSQIRDQIVRNTTLAEYFKAYNLGASARIPPEVQARHDNLAGRSNIKDLVKTQGDIFEAYVAAIIVTNRRNGLALASEWLKSLWGRTLRDEIHNGGRKQVLAPSANVVPTAGTKAPMAPKEELSRILATKEARLRYEDLPCSEKTKGLNQPLYRIGVYLDGWREQNKLLGTGTALSKKEAGKIAATVALQSHEVREVLAPRKEEWVKARDSAVKPV